MRKNSYSRSSNSSYSRSGNPKQFHGKPKFPQGNRQNDRFNDKPKDSALQLYPSSVIKVFHDLLVQNVNAKTYDDMFYKLQTLMKSTFKAGKPANLQDLQLLNHFGITPVDVPIPIAQNTFDAEKWADIYVRSIPDVKLPVYDAAWSVPFLWIFNNIQTSIDGIDRSKWIDQTQTYDKENRKMIRSHDDYERDVASYKEHRAKILKKLTDTITDNQLPVCPSIEDSIVVPAFTTTNTVHMFYGLRLAWLLITMHGNHINFGPDLNPMTIYINPSKKHTVEQYIEAMRILRCDQSLRSKYGEELTDCLAKLIETTFILHHSGGVSKDNYTLFAKQMIDIVVTYLDTTHDINPVRRTFGNPLQRTLKLLKQRYYNNATKVEVVAILQTYPIEILKAHLLGEFISNNALTNCMFDEFLLMYKLYDIPTIRQAIIGGFASRSTEIKIHQLAHSMVFGIITPAECLHDDTFLNQQNRVDSIIVALENAPVDLARSIYDEGISVIYQAIPVITSAQAYKLNDNCKKLDIKCPAEVLAKLPPQQ